MTSTPAPMLPSRPVISEPGKEIMGGGKNAKWVKACTELYLGNRGIEKIRGFEPYENLTTLWLNNNKLKKINNLDSNFRIKALYAQDNEICTLKGSLPVFKFLETLDLSNNLLRDLDKIVAVLSKFKYLKNLNLTGNPCVEEPDYRLIVIYNIPSLQILDLHVVTDAERLKAQQQIGGETKSLTVAFGEHIPREEERPTSHSAYPSLEHSLAKEAEMITDKRRAAQYAQDTALFATDPFPEANSTGARTLPPNAGILKAQARSPSRKTLGDQSFPSTFKSSQGRMSSNPFVSAGVPSHRSLASRNPSKALTTFTSRSSIAQRPALERYIVGSSAAGSPYKTRDYLTLYSARPGVSPLQEQSTRFCGPSSFSSGGIRFEQEKYEEFLKLRSWGREKWQLRKNTVQV